MKEKIEKLESLLESKYENWTAETLLRVVNESNLLELFTTDVAAHLAETKVNESIKDIMEPVKYGHYLRETKREIESYLKNLKEEKDSAEDFKKNILNMKEKGSTIQKAGAYLAILSTIESYEFTEEDKKDISKILTEVVDIMKSLKLEEGIQVISELMDIVFPIRELYLEKYKQDPLPDFKDINNILIQLNEMTKNYFESIEEDEHNHDHSETNGEHEEK
jgi:hypothetical protein